VTAPRAGLARGRLRLLAGLLAIVAGLAACSGVPSSSQPQVVRSVGGDESTAAAPETPAPGADPRSIVEGFLAANVSTDIRHTDARQYLTTDAQRRWQDGSATIVDDVRPGLPDASGDVTVTAQRVGTVTADGIYTSALRDPNGGDTDPITFTFGMIKNADGQWRIDQLAPGVIVSEQDFESAYRQYPLYFFDTTEQVLVPDMRYTATAGQSLASFLLAQLVAGPRPELSAMISELPDQPAASNPTVTMGSPTEIDLVSIRQLPSATLTRLAAQLAYTMDSVSGLRTMRIVEAGAVVDLAGHPNEFSAADFPGYVSDSPGDSEVLFVRAGAILSSTDGKALPGNAGTGELGLTSVARSSVAPDDLAAVGVQGGMAQLYTGTEGSQLTAVAQVRAPQLTRPTWASTWGEVWVSDGANLWRVASNGTISTVSISARPGSATGTIVALRMSRDGSRLAVIYDIAGVSQALWVGTVVRNGSDVRVEQLTQITPNDLKLTDVAWSDEARLWIVGQPLAGDFGVWTVQVDGSVLSPRSTTGLPPADPANITITAAPGQFAWISVGNAVWEQRGAGWVSAIGDAGTTPGLSPAYQD
jgi:hypothetical protein